MATFNVTITYNESKNLTPDAAVPMPEIMLTPDGVQYLPDYVKETILSIFNEALTNPQYNLDHRMKDHQKRMEEEKILQDIQEDTERDDGRSS